MRARRHIAAWLVVAGVLGAGPAPGQTSVRLHHTARVAPDQPLRVGDIARLEGERAAELAGVIVLEDPAEGRADASGWVRIDLSRVREVLTDRLGPGIGLVALGGEACDVRVIGGPVPSPAADAPTPERPALTPAAALVGLETVRGAIARELVRLHRIGPTDLRLGFDESDLPTLDTPTRGRVVEVQTAGASSRLPVRVAVYEHDRLVVRESLRVEAEVRRGVVIVREGVARGHELRAQDVSIERRWVSLTARPADPEEAVGALARKSLAAGELVEARHVEPPVLVQRGDLVMVRAFVRGMVVRREAHALEAGRRGETIELAPRHDAKARFRATVTARGEAQVWTEPLGTAIAGGEAGP
jgi:flagella basal body P-ring formation protein FlgA